ncbi:hypothetical protein N7456_010854 [Penicillium angulare]|uniref:Uncharacterized protein n=1 Tax=Penicillium angulare TaxID=116970 RepID=A0A9W9JZC3_9EURO|nr:hypothetical protein N7456_010854 [Penicillium angulare]
MSQNSFHKSHGEDTWLEKGPEFPDLEESLEQDTNHPGSLSGDDNLRNESPDDESILSREEGEEDESIISSDSSSTVSDDQPSDDDVDDESVA